MNINDNLVTSFRVIPAFHYDQDDSSEFKIEKVSVEDKNIFESYEDIQKMKKIISFYGDVDSIKTLFENILQQNVDIHLINSFPASIWLVFDYNEKICYVALVCDSSKLLDLKPFKRESLLITLQRYLQDISDRIIIVPSKSSIENWSFDPTSNPFSTFNSVTNKKFTIRHNNNGEFKIDHLPVISNGIENSIKSSYANKINNKLVFSNNYSKYFFKIKNIQEKDEIHEKFDALYQMINSEIFGQISTRIKQTTILSICSNCGLIFEERFFSELQRHVQETNEFVINAIENYRKELWEQFEKDLKKIIDTREKHDFIFFTARNPLGKAKFNDDFIANKIELFCSAFNKHIGSYVSFDKYRGKFACDETKLKLIIGTFFTEYFSQIKSSKYYNLAYEIESNFKEYMYGFYNIYHYINKNLMDSIETAQKLIQQNISGFKQRFLNDYELKSYYQIKKYSANFVRNDQTSEISLNITQSATNSRLDEVALQNTLKKTKVGNKSFDKYEMFNIFPTKNQNNLILVLKYMSESDEIRNKGYNFRNQSKKITEFLICMLIGDKVKKITDLIINNAYFHYSIEENILLVYDYETSLLIQFKIDGQTTYYERLEDFHLKKRLNPVDSMVYIPQSESILLISNKKLYQLKRLDNFEPKQITCTLMDKNKEPISAEFSPSNGKGFYSEVLYSGAGNYFALRSAQIIDFYDLNFVLCKGSSIALKPNSSIKIFTDKINTYILSYDDCKAEFDAKIIFKCGSNYNFEEENADDETASKSKGNPILDYIYSGYLKYGPNLDILNSFEKTYYYFYIPNNEEKELCVSKYAKEIFNDVPNIDFSIIKTIDDIKEVMEGIKIDREQMQNIARILISRVPIQICTIENENIVPLIDGKRNLLNDGFVKMNRIEDKAKYLSFGYIEKLLEDLNEEVFLCCIIGRQSSGKSYLMNRLFGTRFAVASTRCTDGIWMSYSCLDGKHIFVFDCEGLFSRQRREIEEIKLITFLAALCDFTYLNQDLSFNRHLNSLLNNLSNSIGRINGNNVFKGQLVWTVRDVSNDGKEGAEREFKSHLETFQRDEMGFLSKLFDGKIIFCCLNNFEHANFKTEIQDCRKRLLKEKELSKPHWKNGVDLLTAIKIIMVQLYADDDSSVDDLQHQLLMNELKDKLKENWENVSQLNETYMEPLKFECNFSSLEMKAVIEYRICDVDLKLDEKEEFFKVDSLIEFFKKQLIEKKIVYDKFNHNEFYQNLNMFMSKFADERKEAMVKYTQDEIKSINIPDEKKKAFSREMDDYYATTLNKLVLCLNNCSKCFLACGFQKNHRKIQEDELVKIKLNLDDNRFRDLENNDEISRELNQLENLHNKTSQKLDDIIKELADSERNCDWISKFKDLNAKIVNQQLKIEAQTTALIEYNEYKNLFSQENYLEIYFEQEVNEINEANVEFNKIHNENPGLYNLSVLTEVVNSKNSRESCERFSNIAKYLHEHEKNLHSCLKKFSNDFESANEEINNLNRKLSEFQEIKDVQETEIRDLESKLNEMNIKLAAQKEVCINTNHQIHELKQRHNEASNEINKISQKNDSLNNELNELNNCLYLLEIDDKVVDKLVDDYWILNTNCRKIEELRKELNKIQIEINNLISLKDQEWKGFIQTRMVDLLKEKKEIEDKITTAKTPRFRQRNQKEYDEILSKIDQEEKRLLDEFNRDEQIVQISRDIESKTFKAKELKGRLDHDEALNLRLIQELKRFQFDNVESILNDAIILKERVTKLLELKAEYQESDKEFIVLESNESDDFVNFDLLKQMLIEKLKNNFESEKKELENDRNEILKNIEANLFDLDALYIDKTSIEENIRSLEAKNSQLSNEIREIMEEKRVEELLLRQKVVDHKSLIQSYSQKKSRLEILQKEITEKVSREENLKKNIDICMSLNLLAKEINQNLKSLNEKFEALALKKAQYDIKTKDVTNLIHEVESLQQELKGIEARLCEFNLKEDELTKWNAKTGQLKDKKSNTEQELDNLSDKLNNLRQKHEWECQRSYLNKEKEKLERELKESCSCLSDHKCTMKCMLCSDKICDKKAGHNGNHICDLPNHKCFYQCLTKNCKETCTLEYEHKGDHRCDSSHQCQKTCGVCSDLCKYSIDDNHEIHDCKASKCKFKCLLCSSECSSIDHFHHLKAEEVIYKGESRKLHLCGKEHNCDYECEAPGVCKIEYIEEIKTYESSIGENFNYVYLQPNVYNDVCKVAIPSNKLTHDGKHNCNERHRCTSECPDCKSICKHELNHSGMHAMIHRNKEHCYFTNKTGEQIVINDNQGARRYQVRDQAIAENCWASCKRRGRGHVHLIKCSKERDQCLADGVRKFHSTNVYKGFEDEEFDELNCRDFWSHYKIANPLDGNELINSSKCNFYCSQCASETKVFCEDILWHSSSNNPKDHNFDCPCKDNKVFKGMDICFVIDSTGSMQNYIDKSRDAIKLILSKSKIFLDKLKAPKDSLRVGIVAYRDHCDNEKIIEYHSFDKPESAIVFLDNLKATGGGDTPEAVADGLSKALDLNWRHEINEKLLFLVLDAPPHGRKYFTGEDNYPNGCPCNLKIENLLMDFDCKEVKINVIKLNSYLNMMENEFLKINKKIQFYDINSSASFTFENLIVNVVCKALEDKEITVTSE